MNGLLARVLLILVLGTGLVGSGMAFIGRWKADRQARVVAELALAGQKQLNDSTAARLAVAIASKDSLGGLLEAAKRLNGKLIAGVKLNVPAHDTIVVHDTLPTSVQSDSTRTAQFRDSTFAGILDGIISAPPFPGTLSLHYTLTRPAFSPEVGFVRIGDRVAAVVSWRGEQVQVQAPFALPEPKRLKPLGAFVEVATALGSQSVFGRAGAVLRAPWGLQLEAFVQQPVQKEKTPELQLGVRKDF